MLTAPTSPSSAAEPEEPSEPAPEKESGYEFDAIFQMKIAALAVKDTSFVQRTDGLINPDYFENEGLASVVAVAVDYAKTYKTAPGVAILPTLLKEAFAKKKIRSDLRAEVIEQVRAILTADLSGREFVIDKVAEFARNRAVEKALLESVHLLGKGDFPKIAKLIRAAVDVGADGDNGEYDYWEEIATRTENRLSIAAGTAKHTGITTGYKEIDALLYNRGWGRKELTAIMGAAKRGKSMGLGEFAASAARAGYNAIYFTCEVGTKILADRFDANIAETAMKALGTTPHAVKTAIEAASLGSGKLIIREFASGTLKCSQIRRILERYRSQGIIFDLIVVDYADIMAPERRHEDFREESREIWVDLRAISFEEDAAVLTATQTNRSGAKSMVARDTDIAEDYNKIRTADLTISINATPDEIIAGEARLFFAAARNDAGEISVRIRQARDRMKFIDKVLGIER